MKKFHVLLPEEVLGELKLIAFYEGRSISALVREAVINFKERYKMEVKITNLKEKHEKETQYE